MIGDFLGDSRMVRWALDDSEPDGSEWKGNPRPWRGKPKSIIEKGYLNDGVLSEIFDRHRGNKGAAGFTYSTLNLGYTMRQVGLMFRRGDLATMKLPNAAGRTFASYFAKMAQYTLAVDHGGLIWDGNNQNGVDDLVESGAHGRRFGTCPKFYRAGALLGVPESRTFLGLNMGSKGAEPRGDTHLPQFANELPFLPAEEALTDTSAVTAPQGVTVVHRGATFLTIEFDPPTLDHEGHLVQHYTVRRAGQEVARFRDVEPESGKARVCVHGFAPGSASTPVQIVATDVRDRDSAPALVGDSSTDTI